MLTEESSHKTELAPAEEASQNKQIFAGGLENLEESLHGQPISGRLWECEPVQKKKRVKCRLTLKAFILWFRVFFSTISESFSFFLSLFVLSIFGR